MVVGNRLPIVPGTFEYEKDLENYLKDLPDCLEGGLVLLKPQYCDGQGFPDLLCLDTEGQLVVVEVKYPESGPDALTQIFRYLLAVNQQRSQILQDFAKPSGTNYKKSLSI